MQFSLSAERVLKENKLSEAQLKTLVGHGPRGLIMKADILEIVHNVPNERRLHRESIHVGQTAGASSTTAKKEEKTKPPSIKDTNALFLDIPVTNMRKVNCQFIFYIVLLCFFLVF